VWQKAMDFVEMVYQTTPVFPREEVHGPTGQLRKAAISIPSNIAEGQGRQTTKDFQRFLSIAYGSLREVETQILIGERLQYIDGKAVKRLLDAAAEIGRLLNGLTASLSRKR
jgi:four helix bundle protein